MPTLLQKAKFISPKKLRNKPFTKEELDLFIAFMKGKLTINQVAKVLNYRYGTLVYVNMVQAMRQLYYRGAIEFKPYKNPKKLLCSNCKNKMYVVDGEERIFCSEDCGKEMRYKIIEAIKKA